MIQADNPKSILVVLYDSPRATYAEEDVKNEKPIWDGDVIKISHLEDMVENGAVLKLIRGPENKPLLTGRYLVRVYEIASRNVLAEKIIELTPL